MNIAPNRRKKQADQDSPLRLSKSKSRKFILNDSTKFVINEAYKSARTNIIFALSTAEHRIITFTSSSPAEGKSTTCINLAIALAKMGEKVLIIDSDMRKPAIHTYLKLSKQKGLSSILSGMCTVAEAIDSDVRENLDVISSGPIPPNPAELIASKNMAELLAVLEKHYDYICIDTPPVNVVTDNLLFNGLSAGTIMIVRENYTRHPDLQRALNSIKLANGKVLGFVKTGCVPEGKNGYYKKGYKYNYNYNYGNSSDHHTQHV